ncbi:MAG: M23 family metallopeptidase [Parcubacteria group bacterium]|nr:M23 family metallopeptidase [Parcubacteria group bacterium]
MPAAPLYAGVFSFITKWLAPVEAEVIELSEENSQTATVLKAALNYDPNPSKGGGDITIVGGSALLSEAGPLGTIADIENQPPNSDQISIYVVHEGDSLSGIAKMFGVSINTIIWANNIGYGGLIRPGQTLVILPVSGVRYIVKEGDTISSIAKKYKGSVEEIKQFNNIADAAELKVGDTVVIPDGEIGTPTYVASAPSRAYGTNGPEYSGYYIRPVDGRKTQGLHGFNGVDLGAPYGTPVVAAAHGRVLIARVAGWNGGYGTYAVLLHGNGTQTLYAHLGALTVSAGSEVVQGQIIGYVGSTGRSTGPHLHFEIRGAQNPF